MKEIHSLVQIKSLLLLTQRQKYIVSSDIKSAPSCAIFLLYCKSLGSIKNHILNSKVLDNISLFFLLKMKKKTRIFLVSLVCQFLSFLLKGRIIDRASPYTCIWKFKGLYGGDFKQSHNKLVPIVVMV